MARLWRVAHFVLTDYLELPPQRGSQHAHTAMLHAPTLGSALRPYAQLSGATTCQRAVSAVDAQVTLWDRLSHHAVSCVNDYTPLGDPQLTLSVTI